MRKLKRKIGRFVAKIDCLKNIYSFLVKINYIIFHWDERMRMIHPGNKDEKKYYFVIRPRGNSEGLLSSYFYVVESIQWAMAHNYIPYVDFENKSCQYYTGRNINNTYNAWEYFFTQPCNIEKLNLKEKKNVLLSGWCLFDRYNFSKTEIPLINVHNYVKIQSYIENMVEKLWNEKFKNKNTLGVFVRGTDYVSLEPKGHYIQPSIDEVIRKIEEFLGRHMIDQIYVVTEDLNYYTKLKITFGEMVFSNDDKFVDNYNVKDYVSLSFNDDPYERGLAYLLRILLFAKCEYVVSSKASGSMFAQLMRTKGCVDEYWFELGLYK